MIDVSVYTGRWTDHDYNSIVGDRITLTSNNALVLIAFISLFDALVGNFAWCFVAVLLHRARVTDEPRDALYHQVQVLLRNASDALAFARDACNLGWNWRARSRNALLRTWPLALLALLTSLLFSAAGVLSTQIASTGAVLLVSDGCGNLYVPATASHVEQLAIEEASDIAGNLATEQGLLYMQNCYINTLVNQTSNAGSGSTSSPLANCNQFVKSALSWNISYSNPCPFGTACSVPDSEIIKMDTGLLSSHDDLGINQPVENRVLWRKIETCSPLKSEGFTNQSFHDIGDNTVAATYAYGSNAYQQLNFNNSLLLNYTFTYLKAAYEAADIAYGLQIASTLNNPPDQQIFFPDIALNPQNDSYWPLTLVMLPNRAVFQAPVLDPWFSATALWKDYFGIPEPYYVSDEPGHVLGCLEQIQLCNPNGPQGLNCSPILNDWWAWGLDAAGGDPEELDKLFADLNMNEIQQATINNLIEDLQASSVFGTVVSLGQSSLQAFTSLLDSNEFISLGLAPNQWQIEVNNWFAIGLAYLQGLPVGAVTGPSNPLLSQYVVPYPANDTADNALCTSQKIRSTAFQSFSVLGLALNFVLGAIIISAALLVRHVIPRLQSHRRTLQQRTWVATGNLQLHRLAHRDLCDWEGEGSVPMTKAGDEVFSTATVEPRHGTADDGTKDEGSQGKKWQAGLFGGPHRAKPASSKVEYVHLDTIDAGSGDLMARGGMGDLSDNQEPGLGLKSYSSFNDGNGS